MRALVELGADVNQAISQNQFDRFIELVLAPSPAPACGVCPSLPAKMTSQTTPPLRKLRAL
jgi:hypothetical protein